MILSELITSYKTRRHSAYHDLTPTGRKNVDYLLSRLHRDWANKRLSEIKADTLIIQYKKWSSDGQHVDMAHSLITMLRTLVAFGFIFVEDKQCERLRNIMSEMKFKRGKSRTARVTNEQAIAIRAAAHRAGYPSIALGQAIMTDFGWRQKDAIGGYEPRGTKDDESDIVVARWGQWLRGVRWEELGGDMVFRHVTSKKQKLSEPPVLYATQVMEELRAAFCPNGERLTRERLPKRGAVIINEDSGHPYTDSQWRNRWRKIATAAGVPKNVQNRDSRAGRATHALSIGVPPDRVRQMLGHTRIETTNIYLRDPAGETAAAMRQIAEAS